MARHSKASLALVAFATNSAANFVAIYLEQVSYSLQDAPIGQALHSRSGRSSLEKPIQGLFVCFANRSSPRQTLNREDRARLGSRRQQLAVLVFQSCFRKCDRAAPLHYSALTDHFAGVDRNRPHQLDVELDR